MFLKCALCDPPHVFVLAMNSMDVGRREEARGVIDTAARYTVVSRAGRAWDSAYRQICIERGIGHAISVARESEVYRFGNGGLLTSTERVTVLVVLADHPLLLTSWDIKGNSKTLEHNGRSQPLEDSVAGHYCVNLSPERHAGLLRLKKFN